MKGLKILPEVEIVYGCAYANARIVKAVTKYGITAIVYAGIWKANFNAAVGDVFKVISKEGIIFYRATRVDDGCVTLNNEGDE